MKQNSGGTKVVAIIGLVVIAILMFWTIFIPFVCAVTIAEIVEANHEP